MYDRTWHDEGTLRRAHAVVEKSAGLNAPPRDVADDVINELLNAGIVLRERAPESDDEESIGSESIGQPELPVEYRIQEAYLKGFADGFKTGANGRWR